MIRYDKGINRFNYRVAGVALNESSVLLHQGEGDDFWVLPGGRVELGEAAEETLKREMREEIGTEVEVVRLLWFVENFFTYAEKNYHEIALYFLMRLPPACEYLIGSGPFRGKGEEGALLVFQWFPQRHEVLSNLPVLPSFLQLALLKLPELVEHIVHYGA